MLATGANLQQLQIDLDGEIALRDEAYLLLHWRHNHIPEGVLLQPCDLGGKAAAVGRLLVGRPFRRVAFSAGTSDKYFMQEPLNCAVPLAPLALKRQAFRVLDLRVQPFHDFAPPQVHDLPNLVLGHEKPHVIPRVPPFDKHEGGEQLRDICPRSGPCERHVAHREDDVRVHGTLVARDLVDGLGFGSHSFLSLVLELSHPSQKHFTHLTLQERL